jgi:hypothetical protein
VVPLLAAAEQLPLRAASLDLVTAFNCVHHFGLARFLAAAARVLRPGGQLFIYTRTPQQNARTIWGRYFPGFTEHEQRLHSEAAIRDAVRRTDGLTMVATQAFRHPRTSTAERLGAQARGRHYSTFAFYPPQELRAAIAVFLARLPGPEVSWVEEHLLVIAGGSRHSQAEPHGPASPANQATKDQARQISAGRAGEAPNRRPDGRAQITPLCATPLHGTNHVPDARNGGSSRGDPGKSVTLCDHGRRRIGMHAVVRRSGGEAWPVWGSDQASPAAMRRTASYALGVRACRLCRSALRG